MCISAIAKIARSAQLHDVDAGAWYHEAVDTVLAASMMNGVGNASFAPNQTLSRAMLVQILYNAAGKPAVEQNSTFQDVSATAGYGNSCCMGSTKWYCFGIWTRNVRTERCGNP